MNKRCYLAIINHKMITLIKVQYVQIFLKKTWNIQSSDKSVLQLSKISQNPKIYFSFTLSWILWMESTLYNGRIIEISFICSIVTVEQRAHLTTCVMVFFLMRMNFEQKFLLIFNTTAHQFQISHIYKVWFAYIFNFELPVIATI